MMIKKIEACVFGLFVLFSFVRGEADYSLISDISLIPEKMGDGIERPKKIVLGVEAMRKGFYKLSDEKQTLKGGFFHWGLNLLSLEDRDFFEKSGRYRYILDFKVDSEVIRKEVEIEVRLYVSGSEPPPRELIDFSEEKKEESGEEAGDREYSLSMFVGGRLIVSSKKLSFEDMAPKVELPPSPGVYNPFGPVKKDDPMLNSFSILDAVGAVYGLIKSLTEKKKEERSERPLEREKQASFRFLRTNPEGRAEEVRALISLEIKTD